MRFRCLFLLSLVALSPTLLAQSDVPPAINPITSLAKMGIGLLVTLLAIGALAWFVKRVGINHLGHNHHFTLLGQMSLGQKEKLVLVKVKGREFLLSVCPGSITPIHCFDEDENNTFAAHDPVEDHAVPVPVTPNTVPLNKALSVQPSFAEQLKAMLASGKTR